MTEHHYPPFSCCGGLAFHRDDCTGHTHDFHDECNGDGTRFCNDCGAESDCDGCVWCDGTATYDDEEVVLFV